MAELTVVQILLDALQAAIEEEDASPAVKAVLREAENAVQ